MTIDDQLSDSAGSGLDRRSALKKAALAAGVVAWTTPVVQAVTARPVHAADRHRTALRFLLLRTSTLGHSLALPASAWQVLGIAIAAVPIS